MQQIPRIDLSSLLHELLPKLQQDIAPEVFEKLFKEFGKDPKNWDVEKVKARLQQILEKH